MRSTVEEVGRWDKNLSMHSRLVTHLAASEVKRLLSRSPAWYPPSLCCFELLLCSLEVMNNPHGGGSNMPLLPNAGGICFGASWSTCSNQVRVVLNTGRPNREGSPHIGKQVAGVPSSAFSPEATLVRCNATGLGKVMQVMEVAGLLWPALHVP